MKKRVLLSVLTLLLSGSPIHQNQTIAKAAANSCNVVEVRKDISNIYYVNEVQNQLKNLLPSASCYNTTNGTFRLTSSLMLNNPASKNFTFFFDFQEGKDLLSMKHINNYGKGNVTMQILDGNTKVPLVDFNFNATKTKSIFDIVNTKSEYIQYRLYKRGLLMQINTVSFPNKIILGGLVDAKKLTITIDDTNKYGVLEEAYLFEGSMDDFEANPVVEPYQYGAYACKSGPFVSNTMKQYFFPVDNPPSLANILLNVYSYDHMDGELDYSVTSENYTNGYLNKKIGSYTVTLESKDNAGNVSILTLFIVLQDKVAPIINGPDEWITSYKNMNLISEFLNEYDASDNNTPTSLLHIEIENYEDYDFSTIGDYDLTLVTKDISNNYGYRDVSLNIIDDVAPILYAPNSITVSSYNSVTIPQIIEQARAYDEIDGEVEVKCIGNNYSANAKYAGTYEVKLQATDSSNNRITATITMNVIDDKAPIWFIDEISLTLLKGEYQDATAITKTLMESNQIQQRAFIEAKFIKGIYQDNYHKVGLYETTIEITFQDLSVDDYDLKIKVVDKLTESTAIKKTLIDHFIDFISFIIKHFKRFINFVFKTNF